MFNQDRMKAITCSRLFEQKKANRITYFSDNNTNHSGYTNKQQLLAKLSFAETC